MAIPNLGQWVGDWRLVQTHTVPVGGEKSISLNLDLATEKLYKITAAIASSTGGLVQAAVRVNGSSTGYKYVYAGMAGAGVYSGVANTSGYAFPLTPGFTGGAGFGAGENILFDFYLAVTPTGVLIASKAYTNGSGSGDNFYFSGQWTSVATPVSVVISSDVDPTGVFSPSFFDAFAVNSRFDVYALNNDTLYAS